MGTELLVDLKARGLAIAPELATGDGTLGFRKALEEVWPTTRHQRCTVHKTYTSWWPHLAKRLGIRAVWSVSG